MCSKNDTDATYCSEVEELLKATIAAPKKSCKNAPLRRSQRLSLKHKKQFMLSGSHVDAMRSEELTNNLEDSVKSRDAEFTQFTPDIFSTKDLREAQEMFCTKPISQRYDISLNQMLNCSRKDVTSGVPLDLSKKSKVLTGENVKGELQVASANAKKNKERQINSPRKKTSGTQNFKRGPIKNFDSLKCISNSEDISFNVGNSNKRACKGLQSSKENSSLISDKRMKLFNQKINNSAKDNNCTNITKQKVLHRNKSKQLMKPTTKNSKKIPIKTSNPVKYFNHSENIYSDNTISDKRNIKTLQSLNENSKLISGKRIKLSNEHIEINKLENHARLLDSCSQSLSATNTTENLRKSTFADNFNAIETIIKPIKRSLKITSQSAENRSEINSQSKELQHIHQNIKSEPSTSLMYVTTSGETIKTDKHFAKNIFAIKTIKKELKNNPSQAKIETSTSAMAIYPKSCVEFKSSGELRNATTISIKNKKLSGEDTASVENKLNNLENEHKKVETEIFFKKSNKEKNQKQALQNYSSDKTKELSDQRIYGDELNRKKLNINTESHLNSSNGKIVFYKALEAVKSIQQIKQTDETIQAKPEFDSKKSNLYKNYIKSFDRNNFLDKIQNSRNYIDKLSAQNNNNNMHIFEIPPTPAESTQDFPKKSNLPDNYPPPEVVCTHSLHIQPNPKYIITPDNTICSELLNSSSSSPSLPESLCEFFQTKDIKDILNVERTSYRLYNYHIQALALILNLRLEYLRNVLDKIINISPDVLKNIDKAVKMPFVPDYDIFPTLSDELWASSDMVLNSQSPKQRLMSTIADDRTKY